MGRRPLLGAYIPPVVAVWMMRRLRASEGLRERDVDDAVAYFRSTGQHEVAAALSSAFAQLREAERQWEQRRRDDSTSVDGNAETPAAETAPASGVHQGPPASGQWVDTQSAAGILGVTERRVRQLLAGELLVGRKIGRQWLVERASITTHSTDRRLAG